MDAPTRLLRVVKKNFRRKSPDFRMVYRTGFLSALNRVADAGASRCRERGDSLESAAAPFGKALLLANTDSGRFLIRMQSARTVDPGEKDDEFKLRWPKHPGHDDGRFSRLLFCPFPTGPLQFFWRAVQDHSNTAVRFADLFGNLLSRQPFDVPQSNHLAMIFRQLDNRLLLDGILFERGISTFDTG